MPTAEENIYNRLSGIQPFHPFSAELLPEDWSIEPGDVVKIKSDDGEYNVPIYSTGINWTGASVVSLSTTGNQERKPLPELKRKEFEQSRATYGNSMAIKKANEEIENHWQHITQVTDQGMSDAFGIIGVKIGADGKPVKDSNGNYVWDDSGTGGEIWGHLNRTAWSTQIVNHIKDANGKIISLGEVYTDAYGNAIINAINDQRTGTARIKADRIQIQSTSGSGIVLDNNGNISINAAETVTRINGQTGSGTVFLNAALVKLNGELIVGEDSQGNTGLTSVGGVFTHIDVNWIEAVNINVEEIDAGASVASPYLQGDELYVTQDAQIDGTLTIGENEADVSGAIFDLQIVAPAQGSNTYTLQKKSFSDSVWQDVGTFSRATTLDGAWSSGVYTVTASPQGNTESTKIYLGATGNGSSNFSVNTYHDSIAEANIAISDYIYLTEEVAAKTVSAHWHNAQGTAYGVISTQTTYNAGQNSVNVTKGNWNGGIISFTPSAGTGSSKSVQLTKANPTWDGNTASVEIWDGTAADAQHGVDTGYTVTVNATPRYRAGSASVGLASPDWGTAPSPLTNSRTVSVSTSGRVDSNGTAANLTKAIALYLTQGSFDSAHQMTVSLRDTSSSGTIRAETDVDASGIYYAGWNSAASAVSYPGAASGQVLNATLTLPNTGASSSTPAPTKDVLLRVEKSATPSANAAVTAQYSTNNGSTYTKFLRINVGNMYTAGQNSGWAAAWEMVDMPDLNTSTGSFDVKVPSSTQGQQDTHSFTVQKDTTPSASGNVSVYMDNLTVARVPIGDWYSAGDTAGYNRGYTQGINDVGVYITKNGSWVSSWTVQSGDSETFYPAKWINGSLDVDTSHGLTVTASGGSSQHDIRITASIRGGNRPVTTEIFSDTGAYEDLHNARPGYYTFKVTCGGTEKWYYFRVGNP